MTAMRWKTAGIAAALLLTASSTAMAATANWTARLLALEQLTGLTTQLIPSAGAQNIINVKATTTFGNAQIKLTFNLAGGKFSTAVTIASVTGAGVAPCTLVPASVAISTGGAIGDSSVAFLIDPTGCTDINWQPPVFNNFANTGASVASITLTLANSATLVDNGITAYSPVSQQYIPVVDANTGSIVGPTTSQIDIGNGSKTLVAGGTTTATTFQSGTLNDTVNAVAFNSDLTTNFKTAPPAAVMGNGTGVLTFTGIPAAVVTAPVLTPPTTTCSVPAGGSSVCNFTNAQLAAFAAPGPIFATFTVNGTTVINPAVVNGNFGVTYAVGQTTVDVKFNGTVATIGNGACAADFGSVVGANPYGIIATLRAINRSGQAANVFAAFTKEDGTQTGAIQLTQANTGVNAGLNASNQLVPGGALEVRGPVLETISGFGWTGPDGRSRARVRILVQTNASTFGQSIGVSGAGPAGCSAEGFLCTGTAACSLMEQVSDGKDGFATAAPNK